MEAASGAIGNEVGMSTPRAQHEFIMTQEESKDKNDFVTVGRRRERIIFPAMRPSYGRCRTNFSAIAGFLTPLLSPIVVVPGSNGIRPARSVRGRGDPDTCPAIPTNYVHAR